MRDYVRHLRDTRTEVAILIAGVALALVLADPLLMAVLERLAPAAYARVLGVDAELRRWIVGLTPAFALLLGWLWLDWRRLRRDG